VSGFTFPPEISRFMLEMQVEALERRRKAVLADPVKHKKTLDFPEGARMAWRYWEVKGKRFPRVRYCYSTERNLAGYFLGWRETINRDGSGERDQWLANKRRASLKNAMLNRYKAHQARLAKTGADA
jgi:hypothetical protein